MEEKYNGSDDELVLNATDIDIEQSKRCLEKLLPTARLIDDYYFSLYAQCYPEDFSMIVSTFLDKEIDIDISTVKYQRSLNLPDNGKDVRFDVAANTKDGGQVVLEVESKKKFKELRLRYYMSRMDSDLLSKGEKYNQLKDSYVIVVSPVDMRKLNQSRYFVRSCYVESPTTIGENPAIVDNGQIAVYINASYKNEKDCSKLADLIHDFTCENPEEIKTEVIKKHSKDLKSKGKERDRMMELAENTVLRLPLYNGRLLTEAEKKEAIDEGIEQGIEQGVEQKNSQIKSTMYNYIKNQEFYPAYIVKRLDTDIPESDFDVSFMSDVVSVHGANAKMINEAVLAVTKFKGESTEFSVKLLNDTLKSEQYREAFENEQNKA
ncbi:MAG: Rpn family recombination-promoting nuclease/putative transposase, partial [Selenomonadaceae bacterium]|nr:Rpn family recombination-promoting nuclease/putative transposase [Selenomonadaceae bacterium]